MFLIFLPWPTFSRSLVKTVRWPNTGRSFWWNLVKIGGMTSDIQGFLYFSRWHIFHLGMETKLLSNLHSCSTFFAELEYLAHNTQTILDLLEQFWRNLTIYVSTPTGIGGKESNIFLGKINLYCRSHTGLV